MLRWFLSLHAHDYGFVLSPEKLPKTSTEEEEAPANGAAASQAEASQLSAVPESATQDSQDPAAGLSSIAPGPAPSTPVRGASKKLGTDAVEDSDVPDLPILPEPFTPSINKTLNKSQPFGQPRPSLPEGLTVATLKSRLNGKAKVK